MFTKLYEKCVEWFLGRGVHVGYIIALSISILILFLWSLSVYLDNPEMNAWLNKPLGEWTISDFLYIVLVHNALAYVYRRK